MNLWPHPYRVDRVTPPIDGVDVRQRDTLAGLADALQFVCGRPSRTQVTTVRAEVTNIRMLKVATDSTYCS
ncbi:hypothetical protein GCM10010095_17680 [Streptomyces anthocyanicus]|nr:hypothetical protein GCM10010095_17680 [Streptomyces anthocyanicus]